MAEKKKNEEGGRVIATFLCRPFGRAFGFNAQIYTSDRATGLLEVTDEELADSLRSDIKRGVTGLEEVDRSEVARIRSMRPAEDRGPGPGERVVGSPQERGARPVADGQGPKPGE